MVKTLQGRHRVACWPLSWTASVKQRRASQDKQHRESGSQIQPLHGVTNRSTPHVGKIPPPVILYRCYATIARWADIPESCVGNGSVNTFPQQDTKAIEELCFLRGPCRDVIGKGQSQLRVSSVRSVERGLVLEAEE
jgi:hypothetical protein